MTPEETYIKEQLNKTGIVTIENITLTTPLLINQTHYKCDGVFFNNCKFLSELKFVEIDLKFGIQFTNSKFYELIFSKCTAKGHKGDFNPNNENILLKDCKVDEVFAVEECNLERELKIQSTVLKKIQLLGNTFSGLGFYDSTINLVAGFEFNTCTNTDIRFQESTFEDSIRFSQNICPFYVFMDSTFKRDVWIWAGEAKNGIIFNGGIFEDTFKIQSVKSSGTLTFIDATFNKSVDVVYTDTTNNVAGGCPIIYLKDSKFNNGIYINGTDTLIAGPYRVDQIIMDISAELKGNIEFRNLDVGVLNISGNNTAANISLQDLLINQIKIKGFINNAGLIFLRVRASISKWYYDKEPKLIRENALYIDATNFGKAQFFNTDFSTFETIVFHNNILTDISTSLMKWFTPSQLHDGNENGYKKTLVTAKKAKNVQQINSALSSLIINYRLNQELYRQLKFASQRQGDKPNALEFQRHEMNYYRKIVKLRKPRDWSEHLILWSNQSNDFGQSWIKPLWLLIIFSFISFLPVGFLNSTTLDYSHFASSFSDVLLNLKVIFHDNIFKWIVLLNPVHSTKDINENIQDVPGIIYFWDYLSRIVASYFIFQIVSAFRKFNK